MRSIYPLNTKLCQEPSPWSPWRHEIPEMRHIHQDIVLIRTLISVWRPHSHDQTWSPPRPPYMATTICGLIFPQSSALPLQGPFPTSCSKNHGSDFSNVRQYLGPSDTNIAIENKNMESLVSLIVRVHQVKKRWYVRSSS